MEEQLLLTAIKAALWAGEDILAVYHDPTSDFGIERKADNSPLTKADKEAHQRIKTMLQPLGIPMLSEEGEHLDHTERAAWDTLWIVDPLDGTKEFIKRNGEFTVNIALVRQSTPTIGVIYVPVQQVLYFASPETGAWKMTGANVNTPCERLDQLTEMAVRLPLASPKDSFVVVASRSHLSPETEEYIRQLKDLHGDISLLSYGSSLKICSVAEGTADVYPRFAPTMEWDTAAGHAIAMAAGRNIYQVDERTPLTYNKTDLHNPWFVVK